MVTQTRLLFIFYGDLMPDHNEIPSNAKLILVEESKDQPRKPYRKPTLEELGDLRALTLGGSMGYGDLSGTSGVECLPGSPCV